MIHNIFSKTTVKQVLISLIIALLIVINSLSFTSCKDSIQEIDWQVTDSESRLVVEGSFTDQFKKHGIYLKKSANYFYNMPLEGVSHANVSISDGLKTWMYIESNKKGYYETADSVKGIPGKTYTLTIDLENPLNSERHYTVVSEMKKTIIIDSMLCFAYTNPFKVKGNPDSTLLQIISFGKEPATTNDYYHFKIYKNDTILKDTASMYSVENDINSGFNGKNYMIRTEVGSFKSHDIIQFEIWSADKQYFDFITGISNIVNNAGDPLGFSPPMANALGNIKGGDAFGYFRISSVSSGKAFVKKE